MQELWASQRWTHSHLIASAEELSQITAAEGWQVVFPVEAYEPAVVRSDATARLAVLLHCPLGRFQINLQQVDIATDQSLREELKKIGTDPAAVVKLASARGYRLTLADVQNQAASAELSESQLQKVSGGLGSQVYARVEKERAITGV